jgi:hypothetical protein
MRPPATDSPRSSAGEDELVLRVVGPTLDHLAEILVAHEVGANQRPAERLTERARRPVSRWWKSWKAPSAKIGLQSPNKVPGWY